MGNVAKTEDSAEYVVSPLSKTPSKDGAMTEDAIIQTALNILASRLKKPGIQLSSPEAVKDYLTLQLAEKEEEHFTVLFLDVKNRLIAYENMFNGTLTQAAVYPREIAKTALKHNACSVIVAHNHPSGESEPSLADKQLTSAIKKSLETVGVRTLDHIVVAGMKTYSFAEHGEI